MPPNNQKIEINTISLSEEETQTKASDYEDAIKAAGFGKYNFLLLCVPIASVIAAQFEFSALSYVLPVAQCDLNLTLEDKGILNSIIYAGMLCSGFLFGPLIDIFGRRKILMSSLFLVCIFIIMSSLSSSFVVLLVAKFFCGAILNGHSAGLLPYISEFHAKDRRSSMPIIIGFIYDVGSLIVPLFAWLILPLDIEFILWKGVFEIKAWNVFLFLPALPAFISGIIYFLMPETPKFLMTSGNNGKALRIFKKMYKVNTGLPQENYPVSNLINEKENYVRTKNPVKEAWRQLSPLFSSKHAKNLTLVCVLETLLIICNSTLRVWLPQIFQTMNDYESSTMNGTGSFCDIISSVHILADGNQDTCNVNLENSSVYVNSSIVAVVSIVGSAAAAYFIHFTGKRTMLGAFGLVGSICVLSLYFATTSLISLVLICTFIMCFNISIDIVFAIIIDLFPTTLRASALSFSLMCSRLGVVCGNLIFPLLLRSGCEAPVFTLGIMALGCTFMPLVLPNTDMKSLE